jgi:hypothetical protein
VVLIFRGHFKPIWKELPQPTFDMIDWCRDDMSYMKAPIHLVTSPFSKVQPYVLIVRENSAFGKKAIR